MPCVEILKTLGKCRNQIRLRRRQAQRFAAWSSSGCARDAKPRASAACLHCATARNFADGLAEDWDGMVGSVVVQRAVTSGVIAPVTRGRTSSLFSMTTVHSAPDLSRQFVSSRLRAPSISLGLATQ